MPPLDITRRETLIGTGATMLGVSMLPSVAARSDELTRELNEVRARTRAYKDIAVARQSGFEEISPYVPAMGFHFSDRTPPFGTDRTDPPVLVYATTGNYNPGPGSPHDRERDHNLRLVAVEWIVHGNQTADPPNLFSDEESSRHLAVTEEEGWEYNEAQDFTALHAWVHRGNPAGVFNPTNPQID